jgi:hypothetical protein
MFAMFILNSLASQISNKFGLFLINETMPFKQNRSVALAECRYLAA